MAYPWLALAGLVWILTAIFGGGAHSDPVPSGWLESEATAITESRDGPYGTWALAAAGEDRLLLDLEAGTEIDVGDQIEFSGFVEGEQGRIAGRSHSGSVAVVELRIVSPSRSLSHRLGAAVRSRVVDRLEPYDPGRALLAGFLIGETSHLGEADVVAMRRSGLAHFVAVSGSNVALFLGLLFVVAGPLATGPRRRAVVGLLALPIYASATGFEPSVIRASVMAGLALGGRLLGIVLETWQLLSLGVCVALVAVPELAGSLGFQLSVAATAGVVVGARWPVGRSRVSRALAVTMGAQLAVAPLLLIAFGTVPLLSPLANLIAAPLVAVATVLGAVGVLGPGFLVDLAASLSDLVLWVARGTAVWPQLGPWGTVGVAVVVVSAAMLPRARSYLALAGVGVLLVMVFGIGQGAPDPGVVVLDVGQGDALLLHGGGGRFALVDGGPDPAVLIDGLRRYGVGALELVVLTHVHADHAEGLSGIPGAFVVGQLWATTEPHSTEASNAAFELFAAYGVPKHEPRVGDRYQLGELLLVVEGPLRPYASPNDQSVVLSVHGAAASMILAGDVEVVAQRELAHLEADILKVPHQGAATSDPEWLERVDAELAVISVGPNQFGHPAPWVIELLEESGARVLRTDEVGDVVVPLG